MKRLFWYLNVFGMQGGMLALCAVLLKCSVKLKIHSKKLGAWVAIRTKSSDLAVFEKVIANEEYKINCLHNPCIIIDAGANIGLSTLYFATQFPSARVIAIEPDESNFRMLEENVARFDNVFPIRAALWKRSEMVNLMGEKHSDFRIDTGSSGSSVQGITVEELMRNFSIEHIDLFKMDIEGAEKEVFESDISWINKTSLIVIELHDRFKPGCSEAVNSALKNFHVKWEQGENSFFLRNS